MLHILIVIWCCSWAFFLTVCLAAKLFFGWLDRRYRRQAVTAPAAGGAKTPQWLR